MVETTLVSRLVHCVKTSDAWASYSVVPKRGELCIESTGTGFKIKVGDGVNVFADLGYVTDNNFSNALYAKLQGIAEGANKYILPTASSSILGGVKSGGDITIDSGGIISINDDSHNHVMENIDGLQDALAQKSLVQIVTWEADD